MVHKPVDGPIEARYLPTVAPLIPCVECQCATYVDLPHRIGYIPVYLRIVVVATAVSRIGRVRGEPEFCMSSRVGLYVTTLHSYLARIVQC